MIIASGSILALKGPGWWHFTGIGHFFNSIHLWSVELFFFFMVIHLWGKYWMAAWRGGRARVWITGAVTFLVAVPCALTGYVSQQNFDAQWISTQAKDGLNSVGVGAFFNVTNFGQMYSYHVLLLPVAVVALVVAHILLVRKHGVVPPFELDEATKAQASEPAASGREPSIVTRRERRAQDDAAYREWKGGYRSYDLVKEASIALGVVLALAVVLTVLFSSPDEKPSTIEQWSTADPVDFVTTATTELDGSSGPAATARRTTTPSSGQHIAFIYLQKWLGVSHPIDTAQRLRARPAAVDHRPAGAAGAPSTAYQNAPAKAQTAWTDRLREGAEQGHERPRWRGLCARRKLRSGPGDDGRAAPLRAGRRARRCAADQQAVLPDRLHQAAAADGRRQRALRPRRSRSICSATSGA